MKVGTILTMMNGIDLYLYRDLMELDKLGHIIKLFPIRYGNGLYKPKESWQVHRYHPILCILKQPFFFFKKPRKYIKLLLESLKFSCLKDFLLAEEFAQHMKDIAIIHSIHGDHKFFIGYFCKMILSKPLIVTIHAYELYKNPNPLMFKRSLLSCDKVITVTEYNKNILIKKFDVPNHKIEIIRSIVDMDEYRHEKKFKLLIVSYFTEKKGHEILFRAIKQLNMPQIEIWVVGSALPGDIDPQKLERKAKDLRIDHQTVFFGPLSGPPLKTLYRECDVFCLPSRTASDGDREGFPSVLAEAMAFGKPVIITRHVEIPRIVKRILVDENDVDGLAQAIRYVLDNSKQIQSWGKENRKIAERYFSPRNVIDIERVMSSVTR
ncbi:MAG: glycosyltransferase family 4 protein [Candidatus Hodarchaeota archaeon]